MAIQRELGGLGRHMRVNQVTPVAFKHEHRHAASPSSSFRFRRRPVILVASPARAAAEKVPYAGDAKPGTIVIQSEERRLYLITGKDQARQVPGRSRLFRQAMVRHHADRQQTRQAGVEAACVAAR